MNVPLVHYCINNFEWNVLEDIDFSYLVAVLANDLDVCFFCEILGEGDTLAFSLFAGVVPSYYLIHVLIYALDFWVD